VAPFNRGFAEGVLESCEHNAPIFLVGLKLSKANKDGEKLLCGKLPQRMQEKKVALVVIDFPHNQDRCEKWIAAVRRNNWIPNWNT